MSEGKPKQDRNLPAIAGPRLPYHPAIQERFGYDLTAWRALVDAVYPLAKETGSVILALSYCKARNLDPFKKPVHIVPMWNSNLKRMVETVWPGIGELRTTAFRTGQYAGRDEAKYGATKKEKIGKETLEFPEWCQVTAYRLIGGQRVPFPGPRVYWKESYATAGREDPSPNSMWRKRPFGQLDKCAEAAALRAAFPEEVGNEFAAEEMEGRVIEGTAEVVQAPKGSLTSRLDALASDGDELPPHDEETGEVIENDDAPDDDGQDGQGDDGGASGGDDNAADNSAPSNDEAIEAAYARGKAARGKGVPRKAVPGEYRSEGRQLEADAWINGWEEGATSQN